jgi:hypothetical protein
MEHIGTNTVKLRNHIECMGEIFKSTNVGRNLKCRHYLDDLGVIPNRSITLSYNSKSFGFEVASLNCMELLQERV